MDQDQRDEGESLRRVSDSALIEELDRRGSAHISCLVQQVLVGQTKLQETITKLRGQTNNLRRRLDDVQDEVHMMSHSIQDHRVAFHEKTLKLHEGLDENFFQLRSGVSSLRQDLRVLQRTVGVLHSSPPRESNPSFALLPPEIRHMIWDFATPGKILEIEQGAPQQFGDDEDDDADNSSHNFNGHRLPPVTSQVCRESRAVACRHGGQLRCLGNLRINPWAGHNAGLRHAQWAWFDPGRDTLFVHADYVNHEQKFGPLIEVARHIALPLYRVWRDLVPLCADTSGAEVRLRDFDTVEIVMACWTQNRRQDPEMEFRHWDREHTMFIPVTDSDIALRPSEHRTLAEKCARPPYYLKEEAAKDIYDALQASQRFTKGLREHNPEVSIGDDDKKLKFSGFLDKFVEYSKFDHKITKPLAKKLRAMADVGDFRQAVSQTLYDRTYDTGITRM